MPMVVDFLRQAAPDVLCLQETKCRDGEFPFPHFGELGYEHIFDQRAEGLSRRRHRLSPAAGRTRAADDFCDKGDARHIGAAFTVGDGRSSLHNFYVPAGGDEPDPAINAKFAHKLAFFDEFRNGRAPQDLRARTSSWSATSMSRRWSTTSGATRRC